MLFAPQPHNLPTLTRDESDGRLCGSVAANQNHHRYGRWISSSSSRKFVVLNTRATVAGDTGVGVVDRIRRIVNCSAWRSETKRNPATG